MIAVNQHTRYKDALDRNIATPQHARRPTGEVGVRVDGRAVLLGSWIDITARTTVFVREQYARVYVDDGDGVPRKVAEGRR